MDFKADRQPVGEKIRKAARAGQFYPGQVDAMKQAIAQHMAVGRLHAGDEQPQFRRAVMLPHAGWQFCADTIGKTLARTTVPKRVIIIGPRHTPGGPNWSVACHDAWDIPGATVPIATDWAQYLAKTVPGLQCEPQAHRVEHGSEVLIPFLHHLNPDIAVLPIVIGHARYEDIELLGQALASICDQCQQNDGDRPLLVISSDMNHFAGEPENRRLDHMALDAMCSGDPKKLYDTCINNDISMCGMIPACIIMRALLEQSPALRPQLIDYCNSASTTGDESSVVGYAGVLLD